MRRQPRRMCARAARRRRRARSRRRRRASAARRRRPRPAAAAASAAAASPGRCPAGRGFRRDRRRVARRGMRCERPPAIRRDRDPATSPASSRTSPSFATIRCGLRRRVKRGRARTTARSQAKGGVGQQRGEGGQRVGDGVRGALRLALRRAPFPGRRPQIDELAAADGALRRGVADHVAIGDRGGDRPVEHELDIGGRARAQSARRPSSTIRAPTSAAA